MRSSNINILVLGAGSWGTALAVHLAKNNSVYLWGHDKQHITQLCKERENKQFLPNVKIPDEINCISSINSFPQDENSLVLIVVPSFAFAEVTALLKNNNWPVNLGIAWATKGLDLNRKIFLHQVVAESFGDKIPMAVLSGPTFASEVAINLPTAITIAGNDEHHITRWITSLTSPTFRCYANHDIIGVEIAATTKNIIAIAAGVSDGLGYGANARSAIITRGLQEIMRLGKAFGAQQKTFFGLAGLGDLSLTCSDDKSRNRRLGLLLAQNLTLEQAKKQIKQTIEGALASKTIQSIAQEKNIEMPITNAVVDLLEGKITPKQAAVNLLTRKIIFE